MKLNFKSTVPQRNNKWGFHEKKSCSFSTIKLLNARPMFMGYT